MGRASSDPAGLRRLGQPAWHRREDCAAGSRPDPPAPGCGLLRAPHRSAHGLCLLEIVCKSVFRQSCGLESENMISLLLSNFLDSFLWYFHAVFLMCCYARVSVLRMFNSHENMNWKSHKSNVNFPVACLAEVVAADRLPGDTSVSSVAVGVGSKQPGQEAGPVQSLSLVQHRDVQASDSGSRVEAAGLWLLHSGDWSREHGHGRRRRRSQAVRPRGCRAPTPRAACSVCTEVTSRALISLALSGSSGVAKMHGVVERKYSRHMREADGFCNFGHNFRGIINSSILLILRK